MNNLNEESSQENTCIIAGCPLINNMAKKEDSCEKESFLESLFTIGAVIGGSITLGWLGAEIYKYLTKETYPCPKCKKEVQKYCPKCPNCNVTIIWKEQTAQKK